MASTPIRTALMAAWAALHTTQYGFAISSLNGLQSPLTCGEAGHGGGGAHLVDDGEQSMLRDCIPMSPTQFGLVVSIFTLGGLVGSLGATNLTHHAGRVGTLRVSATAVLLGSAGVGLANSVGAMIPARILVGFGCGLATVSVPLFLAEIAPPSIKRSLGIMNQIFIVIGMLASQSLSFPFAKPYIWRYVLVVSVGLAVLQLIGSLWVREPSAKSESQAGRPNDEEAPLISGDAEVQNPLTIKELLLSKDPQVSRGLLVVLVTQLSQQFCGVSPVMYFSTRILTPVFQSNSRLIALFIIIIKLPITATPAFLIERVGTHPLLLYPTVFMSISALLLAFGINNDIQALSVIAILSFVIAFSVGLGPVTWVVPAEVMPKHAVTAAGSVGVALNWSANFCMSAAFLPLQQWMSGGKDSGEGNIFFVLAVTCLMAVLAMRVAFGLRDKVEA
ncbi:hypothetical protein I316_04251 [Kwoniella heveanensis BCC8398]|uniref:Major facilitator superfamily (MFS) profile domain-containing protein n=1 Tax=Kwoniella heveanensis BCC8398 TaxID=1296120 RepID=A0A1B9GS59_9TREE|nr:hypothetical protein I316_04251 [Kwoniella heveanensis BCC8398]